MIGRRRPTATGELRPGPGSAGGAGRPDVAIRAGARDGGADGLDPRLAAALALLAYVIAALVLTATAWRAPTTSWPGTCCDQEQAIWFLAWTPYAIGNGLDPFFTTHIGAPDGVNLMWNAAMPLLGLLAWIPSQLGGPVFAYNVLLVAGIALSGWTAYLALRRYAGGTLGPLVGGAVYAFSPYVASHAAIHLNLTTAWVPPLFLLVLDELLIRRRRSPWLLGAALGLLSVAQLLIAEELLLTSVIAAGILVLVLATWHREQLRDDLRRLVPALAAATATFLVVGGWPLAAQFLGPQRIGDQVQDPGRFSTDLLNLVVPTPYQLIAPDGVTGLSRDFSGLYHEATAYLGIPLLVLLAVVAARRWSDPRIRTATVTGLALLVLSLGPRLVVGTTATGIPMPWLPFQSLPLLEHVLPARFTLFTWLAVAAIVAIVVSEAGRMRLDAALPRFVAVAIALVVILPAPLAHWTIEIPGFFRTWSDRGIGVEETVLVAPYFDSGAEASPMVWAAVAGMGVRMPEAYAYMPWPDGQTRTGPPPTQLFDVMRVIQEDEAFVVARGEVRAAIAADLRAADVRHVIVGPMGARAQMVGFLTDLFGRAPDLVDGVEIWRDVHVAGVTPDPPDGT
ncbi:MAG TPA: hypothetical protein VFX65_01705 [Candidatus Limnocylindrales bacterium]|nr:hypothetical protein [Candidatus Limnocylindrales bacterium]